MLVHWGTAKLPDTLRHTALINVVRERSRNGDSKDRTRHLYLINERLLLSVRLVQCLSMHYKSAILYHRYPQCCMYCIIFILSSIQVCVCVLYMCMNVHVHVTCTY